MKILIKNGHIVDPSQGFDDIGDIFVDNGKIVEITFDGIKEISEIRNGKSEVKIIDASGLYVFPGLVDMHVHLREPGYEYKETIKTGTHAAIKGGFTSVCCMPNTKPVNDNETVSEFILRKAKSEGICNVYPIGAITKKQEGRELAEMGMMKDAGCVAFSDDGKPVMNSLIMRRSLEYAKIFDIPIISHAEDSHLADNGVMNEGYLSTTLGLKGIPAEAEVVMIKRDIDIASLTGGRLHIAHVSTEGGVKALREAKNSGINVTSETCPHYFTITEDAVKGYNTNAKINPPLRTQKDVEAIKEGLSDGMIDVITSNHHPHHRDDKLCEFDKAAFGISGLETALGLSLRLVNDGILTLRQLIEKMSSNPSKILNIDKGILQVNSAADIIVVNLQKEWTVSSKEFRSIGKNTPFEGWLLKGTPEITIVNGNVY